MQHASDRIDQFTHHLLDCIPCFPDNDIVKRRLSSLNLCDILLIYVNWVDRFVAPRPRNVTFANDFWSNENAKKHELAIIALANAISKGSDITAHLSEEIHTKGYAPLEGKWVDKDFCLNVYDVHHLHLGLSKPKNGLISRTRDLVYIQFTRTTATFLTVGDHQSFNDGTLEKPAREKRSQRGLILQGCLPGDDLTPKERRDMERRGLSTCSNVDGRPIILGLQSMSGVSVPATKHVSKIIHYLYEVDKRLDDRKWVNQYLADFMYKIDRDHNFSWTMNLADLVLYENASQRYMTWAKWIR